MKLVKPTVKYKDTFIEGMLEFKETGEDILFAILKEHSVADSYIDLIKKKERGESLSKGQTPFSTFWLIDKEEFIGRVRIQHTLTKKIRTIEGQIGYTIRPSKRKNGYGKKILALALSKCRELGMDKVLVTCDETNIASKKIIEVSGGIFEKANEQGKGKPKKLLYWITI